MIKGKYLPGFFSLFKKTFLPKGQPVIFFKNKFFINQSKFYRPKISVEQLLNQHQIEYSDSHGPTLRIKYCPFCKKSHHNDPSNLNVLAVNKQSGVYYCHRCASKGSYLDLKRALLGLNVDPIHNDLAPNINEIQQQMVSQTQYFIYKENMKKEEFKDVKQYLHSRGLKDQVITKYNIGCGYQLFTNSQGQTVSVKVLYFPMQKFVSPQQQKRRLLRLAQSSQSDQQAYTQMAKIKIRGIGKENKKYMRQYPPGPSRGLFGLNTIKKSDKTVVLTEGQFDAMSVNQVTGLPALSLPQGANSLPDTIISYLDQFQKVILWMDNDEAGKMNLDKFTLKLGVSRTHVVTNDLKDLKDANDFLQKKPQLISQMIKKARSLPDQNILKFDQIREKIKDRILNEKQFQGVQFSNFNFFNKKVKGVRPAQLSVISGGTGSGKTTLLSQLSIDLSRKKIPVLWGSFEIRNQILITNMLTQYSELNLKKHHASFDLIADQFTELPLYYMSFHGSNDVNKVLGTITYAIQRYGVNFIVIDTLQFLLSGQAQGYKKFDMQDYVMAELRKIATAYNVHIAVVIHPRKTQDNEDIGIHSIYGTSKATQEADNIWVIQNRDGFKIFDIKKNRYDGDVGRVAMGFNKNSKSFFELRKKELQSLFNKQKTIHQILEDRQAQKDSFKKEEKWFLIQDLSQGDEPQLFRKNRY